MSYNNILKFISEQNDTFPPVHLWNPKLCEGAKFYINHNGEWFFNESIIRRHNLCVLFSRIIKKEKTDYYLVSPVEKIHLDCAIEPYKIVDFDLDDSSNIVFQTNLNFAFKPQQENISKLIFYNSQWIPTVEVREGIGGFIDRNVYYKLANISSKYGFEKNNKLYLKFQNITFPLGLCA
ncbi:MAG: DUF1285 domain-containing protein [Gammaproteobacteria bacterium]